MADHPGSHGPGGKIPNQGNPPAAKGIGKNSKRHDLERPTTPGLHDSDLQQGDVSMLEQGQRVTKKKVQKPANQVPGQAARKQAPGTPPGAPDAIDFLAGRSKGLQALEGGLSEGEGATAWLPFVRQMVTGPGSSGLLAGAYINQFRQIMGTTSQTVPHVINLEDTDDALEAALEEGV